MKKLFYSYSHADSVYRDELNKHLSIMKRSGLISSWHDRCILAGDDWVGQIDNNMQSSDLVLLLVSADFLASDYCYDVEMKTALNSHNKGSSRVIPVILRPVDWRYAPFAHIQALPSDGKPISTWKDRDAAFNDVARGIRMAVESATSGGESLAESVVTTGEWYIKIEGSLADFDKARLDDIVARLRSLSGNVQLTIKDVLQGSVILTFESSIMTFDLVHQLHNRQETLALKLGCIVEEVGWGIPPVSENRPLRTSQPEEIPPLRTKLNHYGFIDPLEMTSRFLGDNHILTHQFRNICFREFRPLYSKLEDSNFSIKFSEIQTDINNIFNGVCNTISFKVRDFIVNYLLLHKQYIEEDLSVRIHTITPTADVIKLIKGKYKHQDIKEEELWVTLAWLDQVSYHSKVHTKRWKETFKISSHTAWIKLMEGKEDFFVCDDVKSDDYYVNEDTNWSSQYNAILSVPIRFKDIRTDEYPITYGFLSITSRNDRNINLFEGDDCYHMVKHAADILSLYYLILEFVLGRIGNNE
jgi:hypothetical protein